MKKSGHMRKGENSFGLITHAAPGRCASMSLGNNWRRGNWWRFSAGCSRRFRMQSGMIV